MRAWMKRRPLDYERMAYVIAAEESARFFLSSMRLTPNLVTKPALLAYAIDAVSIEGLWLEFGVYQGRDIRVIASHAPGQVYGFDSFEGLPEDWTHFQKRGRFSLSGDAPMLSDSSANVRLVKGWFSESLPPFLERHTQPVAFVHIDSDLYSSAWTVLSHLRQQIVDGTIILFDDMLNYPGWRDGEYRAFVQFIEEEGCDYEFIGFASSHHAAAVRIMGR